MKLIIFSYPAHFTISQYCKKFALKNLPDVTEVIYAWDDVFEHNQHLLTELKKTENVVLYSQFKNVSNEKNGWLRQQFVKLQLHHMFDDEHYLIIDGDTLLRNTYHFDIQKPTLFTNIHCYEPYFYFMDKCLGLKKKNTFSFISPLFLFEKTVLEQLETYCMKRNGCSIVEFYQKHKWLDYEPTAPFSEFEIYGTFATQILNKDYNYVDYRFVVTKNLLQEFSATDKNLVLQGDSSFITQKDWKRISRYI